VSEWFNSDQVSAVRSCASAGHSWSKDDRERCRGCGWPRDMVCQHRGGTKAEPCSWCKEQEVSGE
jgi:hypothetical protein